jgi:hypothetical protein
MTDFKILCMAHCLHIGAHVIKFSASYLLCNGIWIQRFIFGLIFSEKKWNYVSFDLGIKNWKEFGLTTNAVSLKYLNITQLCTKILATLDQFCQMFILLMFISDITLTLTVLKELWLFIVIAMLPFKKITTYIYSKSMELEVIFRSYQVIFISIWKIIIKIYIKIPDSFQLSKF